MTRDGRPEIRKRQPRHLRARLAAVTAVALVGGCTWWSTRHVPITRAGGVLVERASGMTLYTFDRDVLWSGESRCLDECARDWPPLVAAATARRADPYSILTRPDGTRQWALNGRPLYRSARDRAPGDRAGDGVDYLWRLAR